MHTSLTLIAALAATLPAFAQDAQVIGYVDGLERLVEVQRAGSTTWEGVSLDAPLRPGDKIRTGKRSGAEIRFADGSTVRLGERTVVVFDASRYVRLETGLMWGDYLGAGRVEAENLQVDIERGRFLVGTEEGGNWRVELFRGAGRSTFRGQTTPLVPNPGAQRFANGQREPFFHHTPSGFHGDSLPGSQAHVNLQGASHRLLRDLEETALAPAGQTDIASQLGPANLLLIDPLLPPDPPGFNRAARLNAQGYFAPRFDGNLIGFKSNRGGFVGARLREYGVYRGHFWEVAVSPTTLFDGDWSAELTDLNMVFHTDRAGDFTLGRQRFLQGPVQNTIVGTLMRQGGRDVQDALTWSPALKNSRLGAQVSYLVDAFPAGLPNAVRGKQTGWYARGAFQTDNGLVGLNLTENTLAPRVGGTVDFSVPVVRKRLDLYGELGRDTWGRDLRTLGAYFPALYQKYDLDLFLEYADLSDFGFTYRNEYLLRAYRPLNDRTYGVLALDKRDGESLRFGAGLVLQIGQ
jgi:hypothetical protein